MHIAETKLNIFVEHVNLVTISIRTVNILKILAVESQNFPDFSIGEHHLVLTKQAIIDRS